MRENRISRLILAQKPAGPFIYLIDWGMEESPKAPLLIASRILNFEVLLMVLLTRL
jgi:hypothetical protein